MNKCCARAILSNKQTKIIKQIFRIVTHAIQMIISRHSYAWKWWCGDPKICPGDDLVRKHIVLLWWWCWWQNTNEYHGKYYIVLMMRLKTLFDVIKQNVLFVEQSYYFKFSITYHFTIQVQFYCSVFKTIFSGGLECGGPEWLKSSQKAHYFVFAGVLQP